ncbi:MAG: pterin-4-alpha-carbinolamine dehydratase [Chloroflexi bacterium]|jgi:4a-hydroxytetrahydrobiopterin dehydratase|nr:pterin-4-alpha-carbinolamine dehydratase [Chloroflexota bacterium]
MQDLTQEKCVACNREAPKVTQAELDKLLPQIPDWKLIERDNIQRLERVFSFPDFITALEFTIRIGALAEEEGHHPALLTEWGRVTLTWWTHKIKGLHRNDLIMAARSDQAFEKSSSQAAD